MSERILKAHFADNSDTMKKAREAAVEAVLKHLDIDAYMADPDGYKAKFRAQIEAAFAPSLKAAIKAGARKAKEIRDV